MPLVPFAAGDALARAVILDAAQLRSESAKQTITVADVERILIALRATNWVLGGPNGAAARLAMKRTTLQSKMKKLGISKRHRAARAAARVGARNGKPLVIDGPFAETREQLGG